jgi:hypothetical protein
MAREYQRHSFVAGRTGKGFDVPNPAIGCGVTYKKTPRPKAGVAKQRMNVNQTMSPAASAVPVVKPIAPDASVLPAALAMNR